MNGESSALSLFFNSLSLECLIALYYDNPESHFYAEYVLLLIQPFFFWIILILGYVVYMKVWGHVITK